MRRFLLLGLAAALLTLAILGCGGGGGRSDPTAASRSTPAAGPGETPSIGPKMPSPAQIRAERQRAGAAAAFIVPGADNSVPTFGVQAGSAERDAAGASLGDYLRTRARGDWEGACRRLARATRDGFAKLARTGAKGCPPVLAALSKESDLRDPLVGGLLSLRVHGDNAFALFYGPGRRQYFVPLLREGGTWRPTQPTPLEYPPATAP